MENDIFFGLNDINLSLFKYMSFRYRRLKLDITPVQARILLAICQNREMSCQKSIEEIVHCNKSTISNILKTMEKNGLIKRIGNENDLRRKSIVLTSKAKKILSILDEDRKRIVQDITENISDDEIIIFNKILMKLKYNVERCKNV